MNFIHPADHAMRTLPPLTALRAFEAAARFLSFQDAARELALTPTAISHQVRLLEEFCGKPLFQRRPRPLSLTPAGARLLPKVAQGLDLFAEGLASVVEPVGQRLRITATNAFAARWIMPRMASWRESHPDIGLDIMGTDDVLDLAGDQVDIAIRYARNPPKGFVCAEIGHDGYMLVASPALVGPAPVRLSPADMLRFPLIDGQWSEDAANPPMWFEWVRVARATGAVVPDLDKHAALSFREDLHGIEAAISGYGISICSDVLVARELADGRLVQVSDLSLAGYTFYLAHRHNQTRKNQIKAFSNWIAEQFSMDAGHPPVPSRL
jgi:LysR family glycine cleavage system transcriptional activator